MKLVAAVVQEQDAARILSALAQGGHGATRMASTGGFLRQGNTTILVGVEDDRLEEVLGVLRELGAARRKIMRPFTPLDDPALSQPVEVAAGGAIVFVLDVLRMERY